jgi:creatinine amidohydrolase/Fe(II)-dependent formamide hydrolase-like protein
MESIMTERPKNDYLLAHLSWPQAKLRFKETDTALLPVGAVEQHGRHLPLDVDAWDADHLCREVAQACSDPKPLVLPLIPYGVSYHHQDFPGTLSLSPDTLWRVVYDVGISAARHGIKKLVIVNGHGGNAPSLHLAAQMLNRDTQIFCCVDTGETSDKDIIQLAETSGDVHAGEIETSTTLATRPELVDMSKAESRIPVFSIQYLNVSSQRSVDWYTHTARRSTSGVMGDPTVATAEKGKRFWALMILHLKKFVETLKRMSLEEIHSKRD